MSEMSDSKKKPERKKGAAVRVRRMVGRLADAIASDLFRNGAGERAVLLKLELEDGTFGGGWCREAVRCRIIKVVKSANE
jgi:hypothetical protein